MNFFVERQIVNKMKLLKFASIIAFQTLAACGGGDENNMENVGTPASKISTKNSSSPVGSINITAQSAIEDLAIAAAPITSISAISASTSSSTHSSPIIGSTTNSPSPTPTLELDNFFATPAASTSSSTHSSETHAAPITPPAEDQQTPQTIIQSQQPLSEPRNTASGQNAQQASSSGREVSDSIESPNGVLKPLPLITHLRSNSNETYAAPITPPADDPQTSPTAIPDKQPLSEPGNTSPVQNSQPASHSNMKNSDSIESPNGSVTPLTITTHPSLILSEAHIAPITSTVDGQQTLPPNIQYKQSLSEQENASPAQDLQRGLSNDIKTLDSLKDLSDTSDPLSITHNPNSSVLRTDPMTRLIDDQETNDADDPYKNGGDKSDHDIISTSTHSSNFLDQHCSLHEGGEDTQNQAQRQDLHQYTNDTATIDTNNASETKTPTESKISDNMDKATMIVTREEKPAQIPVQKLLNEENNYPDFQDAEILLIFNANNHFAATLVKDDENNWYGISNYFSEKIIKLQTNHKNWLDQNILNKEKTKIVYFTQRQLDNIEPITIDELTNSLASLPEQTDQSIIDALGELPSGSICVEQSSTEDEAKWVRSFLENIFFSKELLTNDHIDKLKKAVMHSRAKRQISDDTESFIKEALNSIKDCAPNDESYKAMVNNRRTILYKSFGMIKNHDINTFKIDQIIYNSIVSFYGNPYLSYSPEEENSFVEVANNNKIKRAITDDEDFVIININTP
ncbi:predicted cell-wall-anchored protein SasA [bacterium endosymbiont of Mortierella elongata FMR23-6]|nr:predicted cell-wall-anchored protein SasA [bacterium endosymbiont of Mortierella elongata FMR23-6]